MTAFHVAARYASDDVALLLIDKLTQQSSYFVDKNKMLALHHACKCKVEKAIIVEKTLDKLKTLFSADKLIELLNMKDKFENTILNLAVKENHLKIVEMLLKINNSYKDIEDHDYNLPIHIVAKFGSVEMLQLLEKYSLISFEPNNKWDNVFHIAASANKYKFILEILEKYAKMSSYEEQVRFAINAFNRDRFTPLHTAISKGSLECIDIFFKNLPITEIDIDMFQVCIENHQEQTLHFLFELNKTAYNKCLDIRNSANNNILHFACIYKSFNIFKMIIDDILEGIYRWNL